MAHVTSQSKIQKIFQESPILAYRGNKDLKKQIIGNNSIEDNKKKKKKKREKKNYHKKRYPLIEFKSSVVSKLSKQNHSKAHKQNLNSLCFRASFVKASGLFI